MIDGMPQHRLALSPSFRTVVVALSIICSGVVLSSAPAAQTARATSGPLFWQHQGAARELVRRNMPQADARAILEALVRGPNSAERAAGITTALDAKTRLVRIEPWSGPTGPGYRVVFGTAFLASAAIEDAIEQVTKSLAAASIDIVIEDADNHVRSLREALGEVALPHPPADAAPPKHSPASTTTTGALSGKRIAVSPGHGYYYHPTLGWTTQRPLIGGLIEDVHTVEIANRYLIPFLENMGAEVISCRDIGELPVESIVDDDPPAQGFQTSGAWTLSLSSGYRAGQYRFASVAATRSAVATWSFVVPRTGYWPLHVWYRAGSNRSREARYAIRHAGGSELRLIDQTVNDGVWVHLGNYWFDQGQTARVELDNQATTGSVVIADALRFGNGLGSIVRGPSTSGRLRALEASRYWAQYQGAPASIYDSSNDIDNVDDVTCRPRYAEWRRADCFLSLHTNAGGGSGTSSYIHSTSPTPGSAALQTAVHNQLVGDLRREYDPTWGDRGRLSANFGELRLLSSMPGVLMELAFHDQDASRDHNAIHDPKWRRLAARACARGILRYFNATAVFAPDEPVGMRVTKDGSGGLRVAWDAVPSATSYAIEASPDGKSFVEVARVAGTSWSTGRLEAFSVRSFRVRANNASGRSFPSEVLCAGTSHDFGAEVLLVAGFDRLGKTVKGPENTRDYLRQHGDGLRRHGAWSLGFDACSNEAVTAGHVRLDDYRLVIWCAGEESTVDETFSFTEQNLVAQYLARGGRLLVSGAEVAWDLDAKGTSVDQSFFRQVLGVRYVGDDAQTYAFRPAAGGLFAGLASGSFDDGSGDTYNVDYPDVLAPADALGQSLLFYGSSSSDAAAVARDNGISRTMVFGFPLETVRDASLRAELLERSVRWLLAPRAFEAPRELALGLRAPLRVSVPTEPNALYVLAAALTTQPGIVFADGRSLPLTPDAVFALSLGANHAVFDRFVGFLDARGVANASFSTPQDPSLRGLRLWFGGLTLVTTPTVSLGSIFPVHALTLR